MAAAGILDLSRYTLTQLRQMADAAKSGDALSEAIRRVVDEAESVAPTKPPCRFNSAI